MDGVSLLECPTCQGEGVLLGVGRPGEYSARAETFFPSEAFYPCPDCGGEGVIEGCGACGEPFTVQQGREGCGCDRLAKAA